MPHALPSRRALLRAGLAGAGSAVLLGCSGDRVRTPWSPSPTVDAEEIARRVPDGDLLLAARDRVAGYRAALSRTSPDSRSQQRRTAVLEGVWSVQQERLEQVLELGGLEVPPPPDAPGPGGAPGAPGASAADGGGASTAAPTEGATDGAGATGPEVLDEAGATDDAAATTAPGPDPTVVGAALREDLEEVLAEVARSSTTNRAMLLALAAQHMESARLLGAEVDWPPLQGPVGAAAVPVLARTRPAVFGLEVVAARSLGEERELFEGVLGPLRAITRALTTLAGDTAPVPPLGYDLPEPLDDEDDRLQLARDLVHDIAPAALSVADRAGEDVEQVRSLVRIVSEADRWGRELTVDPAPFPGMTLP